MALEQTALADTYDVIVVGSGVGGGTALSNGCIRVGCNRLAKAAWISGSRDAVLDYVRFVAGGCADEDLLATFIDDTQD